MTRRQFVEDVYDWSELMEFGYDVGFAFDDIFLSGDEDTYVNDDIDDYVRNRRYDWGELKDILNGLDFSGEVYEKNGMFDYEDITDLFEDYKEQLIEYCDSRDYWDEEDEDEEEDEEEEDEEEEESVEEDEEFEDDITLEEFLMMSDAVA